MATLPGPMVWDGMGTPSAPDNPYALPILSATIGPRLDALLSVLLIGISLAGILSLFLRYRRSQGIVRQQLKWIAYFFVVAFGAQLLFFELPGAFITPSVFEGLPYLIIIAIVFLGYPVVIGIAILRYRLYDIDIIIRRTLVYAAVTGALAIVYIGTIVMLQQIFVAVTGRQSTVAIVVSTLLIAALFNPLRTRVQAFVDRRFFRRKYDAESTLARFGAVARDEVNLETLTAELLDAVNRTVQPGSNITLVEGQAMMRTAQAANVGKQSAVPGAWLLVAVTLLAMSGGIALGFAGCVDFSAHLERFSSLIFALLGMLILRSQPGHRIGWLCMLIGAFGALSTVAWFYSVCNAVDLQAKDFATRLNFVISMIWLTLMFILLPMLSPGGRFLSPRWRLLAIVGCTLLAVLTLSLVFVPGPMVWNDVTMGGDALDNPLAFPLIPTSAIAPLQTGQILVLSALCLAGIASIALR